MCETLATTCLAVHSSKFAVNRRSSKTGCARVEQERQKERRNFYRQEAENHWRPKDKSQSRPTSLTETKNPDPLAPCRNEPTGKPPTYPRVLPRTRRPSSFSHQEGDHPDSWDWLEGEVLPGYHRTGTGAQGQIGRQMSRNIVQAAKLNFAYLQHDNGDG